MELLEKALLVTKTQLRRGSTKAGEVNPVFPQRGPRGGRVTM